MNSRQVWLWVYRVSTVLSIMYCVYYLWTPLTVLALVAFVLLAFVMMGARGLALRSISMSPHELPQAIAAQQWTIAFPCTMAALLAIDFCAEHQTRQETVAMTIFAFIILSHMFLFLDWRSRAYWETQVRLGMVCWHLERSGVDMVQLRKEFLDASGLKEPVRLASMLKAHADRPIT